MEESHDRAINRSHDRAIDRSLKKPILYLNERARRGEDEQVEESHDRAIWNRSDDRTINRSHDLAIDRSFKKPILYLNERARREEDELRIRSRNQVFINRFWGLEKDNKPKTSTQMNELSSENVIDRPHPWKIRMYRVHSGSSIYEERIVASMDDAAPGINTPRSAFATPNAAVSRTETAEARRSSGYRPNPEAGRGTREHCIEFGSRPTRSESFNLHSGRMRGRSSEDPTGRDFGFDRPQQYVSYIRPLLVYASTVWSPLIYLIDSLESVQRSYTKRLPVYAQVPYSKRLSKLKLQSLEHCRLIYDLIMCYQIVHKLNSLEFSEFFKFSDTILTRGHNLRLDIPLIQTNTRRNFFAYRVVKPWNSLPSSVVNSHPHLPLNLDLLKSTSRPTSSFPVYCLMNFIGPNYNLTVTSFLSILRIDKYFVVIILCFSYTS